MKSLLLLVVIQWCSCCLEDLLHCLNFVFKINYFCKYDMVILFFLKPIQLEMFEDSVNIFTLKKFNWMSPLSDWLQEINQKHKPRKCTKTAFWIASHFYSFFCIAGTLGKIQLPAQENKKQHKPSSPPPFISSIRATCFLFFFFFCRSH